MVGNLKDFYAPIDIAQKKALAIGGKNEAGVTELSLLGRLQDI